MKKRVGISADEEYPIYSIFNNPPACFKTIELTTKELNWIKKVEEKYNEMQLFLAEKLKEE